MVELTRIWRLGLVSLVVVSLSAVTVSSTFADGIESRFFETDAKDNSDGAWLGVQIQTVTQDLATRFDLRVNRGAYVSSVVDTSPAEEAGVRPGDVIIEYNYERITNSRELMDLVAESDPGDEVILFVDRDGKKKRLVAQLNVRPMEQKAKIRELAPLADDREPGYFYRVKSAPYIGISLQSISGQLGDYFSVPGGAGALIVSTLDGSPAEKAGLRAGDVVILADGSKIEVIEDLQRVVRARESGEKIEVTVIRNQRKTKFTVTVAERDTSPQRLGIFDRRSGFDFKQMPRDNSRSFGMKTDLRSGGGGRRFDAYRRGSRLDPPRLPDVVFSRTREKSQRIDNLEKQIQELQLQIETLLKDGESSDKE